MEYSIKHKWLGAEWYLWQRTCIVFHLLGHDLPTHLPGMYVFSLLAWCDGLYTEDEVEAILRFVDNHTLAELQALKKLSMKQILGGKR